MTRPSLLILGHKRHGKDETALAFEKHGGFKFTSSSMFVCTECLWENWGKTRYATIQECYDDRDAHRQTWYEMIAAYNTPDKTRTACTMLDRGYNIYVGMRSEHEYAACMDAGVFDHIYWVDARIRKPELEPKSSFTIEYDPAIMHLIDNNGSTSDLYATVREICINLGVGT